MIKKVYLLLALAAFLMISCEKDGLTYSERQLVGTWNYSKVKYIEDWSISSQDLTDDFEGFELEFKPDFTASYRNVQTDENYVGIWELSELNNGNGVANVVLVSIKNEETGELRQVVFENASISKRTLRANYKDQKGHFNYVLEK